MAAKSMLTAGVAVILGGVLATTPASAGTPTINVRDDPHDVHLTAASYPGVTVTDAERRSVEIKWLKTRPRTDHTVRFKFKIDQVGGNERFIQVISIFIDYLTKGSTWAQATMTIGPNAPAPEAYITRNGDVIDCQPRVGVNSAADTVSMDIANRCVPDGDAKVTLGAWTAIFREERFYTTSSDKLIAKEGPVR
jgi:hypothetical protein